MVDRKIKILLVDDEKGLLSNLVRFLEDDEFEVLAASTGEEAIAMLAKEQVDVGVVDMRLPGIDGNEVILQAHQMQPLIKFIIHTGSTEYCLPSALKELGICDEQIFLKPVKDLGALSEAIRKLVME